MNLRQTGEFEHRGTLELSPHSSQRGAVDILSGAPSTGDGRSDPRSPGECQRIERDVLWRMLTEISVSWKQAQRAQLVTFERNDAAYSAFDVLRTNVLHEMKQNGCR